jgi:ABC-type phosphate transport system substrate-binding protein
LFIPISPPYQPRLRKDGYTLQDLNPNAALPNKEIVVVHRSDGSGTTYIWADYLAKVSDEWQKKVGVATSVDWPCGIGQKGNEGVAGQVQRSPGSIGYIELIYALSEQNPVRLGSKPRRGFCHGKSRIRHGSRQCFADRNS